MVGPFDNIDDALCSLNFGGDNTVPNENEKKRYWKPIHKKEVTDKGEAIYAKIKERMESEHKGEAIAIEVHSGDYFLGKRGIEAVDKGREKHPDGIFYLIRIGKRAYVSFKR